MGMEKITEGGHCRSDVGTGTSATYSTATKFVGFSDDEGIDDRFIVALAGAESTYGLTQQRSIYTTYNRIPAATYLATIYRQLVSGATVNSEVNFSRCP